MGFEKLNGYHDAALVCVGIEAASNSLVLSFRLEDGTSKKIELHGCGPFRMNDFGLRNVVSRLLLYRGGDVELNEIEDHLKWASSSSDSSSYLDKRKIEVTLEKIHRKEATLFLLEPSWGAEMVVLFTEMKEEILIF